MSPKVKVENGEIWVHIGNINGPTDRFSVLREGEWEKLRAEVAANERKRIAFVLDHMEDFAAWIQWRGNPVESGSLLDISPVKWPE